MRRGVAVVVAVGCALGACAEDMWIAAPNAQDRYAGAWLQRADRFARVDVVGGRGVEGASHAAVWLDRAPASVRDGEGKGQGPFPST